MSAPREPIAIVGMGCRFPGASSPAAFWRLLVEGRCTVGEVPKDRFDLDLYYDPRPATPGKVSTRHGGFLENIDAFDADFFRLAPREAERLDPQQRLLLEVGFEALEDAGVSAFSLRGSPTGVFVGMWLNDFEGRLFANPSGSDFYMTTGSGRYSASGRLSYVFGLQGPSLTVDTACSSSLVAVHLACQSIWAGESELALAGGANVILQPHISVAYSQSQMLASDGRCKFGDSRADGYVRSEGAALVALKALSAARRDGDRVHAVILGGAVNNDGRSGDFMTTPAQPGQEDMLRKAYRSAGVSPGLVQYIEAHGTGTRAGDPVELGALGAVLAEGRPSDRPCAVGSVKTNIGHTEGAAGVAGLIKVALSLAHRTIPASLHMLEPSPAIPWDSIPVYVPRERQAWPAGEGPARAGVSAFGISGTNAHIVLEEAPRVAERQADEGRVHPAASGAAGRPHVLLISAKTQEALRATARSYRELVLAEEAPSLGDLCYSASVRRSHHEHRLAVVATSSRDVIDALDAFQKGERRRGMALGRKDADEQPKVVFVFPGQGSQWLGMARELLGTEVAFRESLEACDEAVREEVGWSLLEELKAPEGQTRLAEIDVVQPTLFAIQVALAALWRSWGVRPDAVVGHSMGEVAAAHVSGALSLQDAAAVICRRSRLLRRVSGQGAMAVVGLSLEGAREVLEGKGDRVSIAVSNGPSSTVLSGDPTALRAILEGLQGRDVFCRPVQVDVASHSPQMDPLLPELGQALAGLRPRPSTVPMYSTVVGDRRDLALDSDYWCRNLRQPVLFSVAIEQLLASGHGVFVELSPHPILLPAIEGMFHHLGREGVVLPSMEREKPEREVALASLGALHAHGVPVDWSPFHPEGRLVMLPTYPWQRKRFWLEGGKPAATATAPAPGHPVLGRELGPLAPLPGARLWERTWSAVLPEGQDVHRVLGVPVFAAATLVHMALAAAAEMFGPGEHVVEDVALDTVHALSEGAPRILQTVLTPSTGGAEAKVRVYVDSVQGTELGWLPAGRATIRRASGAPPLPAEAIDPIRKRCRTDLAPAAYLSSLRERGLGGGRAVERLEDLRATPGEVLARVGPAPEAEKGGSPADPSLFLEQCLEILQVVAEEGGLASAVARVPVALESFRGSGAWPEARFVHARARDARPDELKGDIRLMDEAGQVVAEARGVRLEPAESPSLSRAIAERGAGMRYEIAWREQPAQPAPKLSGAASHVLLADRGGVASRLARLLHARGDHCVLAYAGPPPDGNGGLHVDPLDAAELDRLLAASEPGGRGSIVHLWGLDVPAPSEASPLGDATEQPSLSALRVAQALARRGSDPRRLWLVTRGAEPVTDGPGPMVSQAPLWGLGRVLALEQPENWGGLVDLDPLAPEDEGQALLTEIDGDGAEGQVALRGGRRYVARLARAARRPTGTPVAWRRDGSYLITGGLGGLGLQVARWMASRGAGHIVLVGRSGLPARSEWDQQSPATKVGRQIGAVRRLEALGADVTVLSADAGDEAAMGALFASFGKTRPPLHGIVHAAGVLTTEPFLSLEPEAFRAVLQPKVEGAWTLHRLSRTQPLDFFVMFSSGASVWGSKGFAHYAAANHFLDALAHHRAASRLKALSVNWGWWAGGSIAGDEGERFFRQIGLRPMLSGQALASLEALLGEGVVQNTIADVDWSVFKPIYESRGSRPFLGEIDPGPAAAAETVDSGSELRARLEAARPGDRQEVLAAHVATAVASILGFDAGAAIARRLGFFRMGMDSIMTMQLRSRLERSLGRKLPPTVAFEHPTVDALAAYLTAEMFSRDAAPPPPKASPAGREATEAEDLSEDELTSLLAEKLRLSR